MACSVQKPSSSSSSNSNSTPKWKFHVFLSFRGEDTRKSFTDHLYAALRRKGLKTFRDNEELERGEVISEKLLKAIEDSLFAIVVLSKNYASSSWCLDELQKILKSRQELGQQVFPIFYGVDPSDVRHQKGSCAETFAKHEEMFKEDQEKVQKWRDSLTKVADLSGWDSKDWHEAQLIENVVQALWSKLHSKLPSYSDTLVETDLSRLDEIDSLLEIWLNYVHFVGICGMGGIRKTFLDMMPKFTYKPNFFHVSRKDDPEKRTMMVPANQFGNTEMPPEDGFTWRKYGQKEIPGSKYPRGYYRCLYQKLYECPAKKQVQRLDKNPNIFDVTYRGSHTCLMSTAAPSSSVPPQLLPSEKYAPGQLKT